MVYTHICLINISFVIHNIVDRNNTEETHERIAAIYRWVDVIGMRNSLNFVIDFISFILYYLCVFIVSRMLIISHHSQWVLTMGCSFFLSMLSSFAPAPPYSSVVSPFLRVKLDSGLTFILGLQFLCVYFLA